MSGNNCWEAVLNWVQRRSSLLLRHLQRCSLNALAANPLVMGLPLYLHADDLVPLSRQARWAMRT